MASQGYLVAHDPSHPLANEAGTVSQHRMAAFEKYGDGEHPCHWCGDVLPWPHLDVDHLNEVKSDNTPDNLVVACAPCNRMRGAMKRFIRRMLPSRLSEFASTLALMRA